MGSAVPPTRVWTTPPFLPKPQSPHLRGGDKDAHFTVLLKGCEKTPLPHAHTWRGLRKRLCPVSPYGSG